MNSLPLQYFSRQMNPNAAVFNSIQNSQCSTFERTFFFAFATICSLCEYKLKYWIRPTTCYHDGILNQILISIQFRITYCSFEFSNAFNTRHSAILQPAAIIGWIWNILYLLLLFMVWKCAHAAAKMVLNWRQQQNRTHCQCEAWMCQLCV